MAEALLEEYAVVGSVSVADIIYWGFLDADAAFTGSGDSNKGSWSGAGGYEFFSSKKYRKHSSLLGTRWASVWGYC